MGKENGCVATCLYYSKKMGGFRTNAFRKFRITNTKVLFYHF